MADPDPDEHAVVALTFEQGYERLQQIAQRLNESEVPVSELADLLAEGKGLQAALTGHLDEVKGRIERIERGEAVRAFRIVPAPPTSV